MTNKNIDILNILLILISLVLAFKLPFELFLFSYAVLGPLHYLTEINWLKEKNYFVEDNKWMWAFVAFAVLATIPALHQLPAFKAAYSIEPLKTIVKMLNFLYSEIILAALLFAIGLVYFKKWQHQLMFFVSGILVSIPALKFVPLPILSIGVFVPTLIHVYLFTLLFMIFGTLRNKTNAGVIAITVMILCPVFIFASSTSQAQYINSQSAINTITATNLHGVNWLLAKITGQLQDGKLLMLSAIGIKIQMFIAFSYTYHYLNWFTKTSIIGWHKTLSKSKAFTILIIWLGSMLLYWYDFRIGLMALFFISLLHVFLEFPLNITSIKEITTRIKR